MNNIEFEHYQKVIKNEDSVKYLSWTWEYIKGNWPAGKSLLESDLGELISILENKEKLLKLYPESFAFIKKINLSEYNLNNFVYHTEWYLKGHNKKPLELIYSDYFKEV